MAKTTKSKTTADSGNYRYNVECNYKAQYVRLTVEFGNEEMWISQDIIYDKLNPKQYQKEADLWQHNLPAEIMTRNSETPFRFSSSTVSVEPEDTDGNPKIIMGR